ncbi:hypothetical protein GDO81_010097 [Engystomops pustulosus]|uniref:Uncharacterized protein n=1 Tax=Engystomops pustulosus TaxID=76066 RepID=A0AAV7BWV0_ENGPU|nr:hypothetical protein GDO81_010097 [Engystomops pustulosus]
MLSLNVFSKSFVVCYSRKAHDTCYKFFVFCATTDPTTQDTTALENLHYASFVQVSWAKQHTKIEGVKLKMKKSLCFFFFFFKDPAIIEYAV